jgi:hypothetical protein
MQPRPAAAAAAPGSSPRQQPPAAQPPRHAPAVTSCSPSAEKAPQRAVPFILRLPAHCLLRRLSSGMWPWSPKKAAVGLSASGVQLAKASRDLTAALPVGPSSRATLPEARSKRCTKERRPLARTCERRPGGWVPRCWAGRGGPGAWPGLVAALGSSRLAGGCRRSQRLSRAPQPRSPAAQAPAAAHLRATLHEGRLVHGAVLQEHALHLGVAHLRAAVCRRCAGAGACRAALSASATGWAAAQPGIGGHPVARRRPGAGGLRRQPPAGPAASSEASATKAGRLTPSTLKSRSFLSRPAVSSSCPPGWNCTDCTAALLGSCWLASLRRVISRSPGGSSAGRAASSPPAVRSSRSESSASSAGLGAGGGAGGGGWVAGGPRRAAGPSAAAGAPGRCPTRGAALARPQLNPA